MTLSLIASSLLISDSFVLQAVPRVVYRFCKFVYLFLPRLTLFLSYGRLFVSLLFSPTFDPLPSLKEKFFVLATFRLKKFQPRLFTFLLLIAPGTCGNAITNMIESTAINRKQVVGMPTRRQLIIAIGAFPSKELCHLVPIGAAYVAL
jgi:hypothetical protein